MKIEQYISKYLFLVALVKLEKKTSKTDVFVFINNEIMC